MLTPPFMRALRAWTPAACDNAEGAGDDVRGRRMRTAERTLADLLEPPLKAPPKKKLADFELLRAPRRRRLLPLAAIGIDRIA